MEPRDVAPRPHAASFPPSSPGAAHACSTGVRDASDACALESFVGTVFRSFPVAFFQVRGWLLFSARVGCFSVPGLVAFQCQGWLLFSARIAALGVVPSLRVVPRSSRCCSPAVRGLPGAEPRVSPKSFRPARPHALTPACSHARTLSRPHVRTFSRRRQSCITARPCSCTTSCRSSCGGTWRRFRRVVGKRIRCGGRRSRRWVRCL